LVGFDRLREHWSGEILEWWRVGFLGAGSGDGKKNCRKNAQKARKGEAGA
jgi:hypothetical protein